MALVDQDVSKGKRIGGEGCNKQSRELKKLDCSVNYDRKKTSKQEKSLLNVEIYFLEPEGIG